MEELGESIYEKYNLVLDYSKALTGPIKFMNNSNFFYIGKRLIFKVSVKNLVIKEKFNPGLEYINTLTISPNDQYLAVGNYGHRVVIFDTTKHEKVFFWSTFNLCPKQIRFFEDSERIIIPLSSEFAYIWNFKTGVNISAISFRDILLGLVLTHSEKIYMILGKCLEIFDLHDLQNSKTVFHINKLSCISKTSDDSLFVIVDELGNILLYTPGSDFLEQLVDAQHNKSPLRIAFSYDNKLAATGGECNMIYIWDLESKRLRLKLHNDLYQYTMFLAFNEDSSKLASCFNHIYVSVWDTNNGEIKIIGQHENYVMQAEISKNHQILITSSVDQIFIWDTKTWCLIREICGHRRKVRNILDLESIRVIVSSDDQSLKFWDVDEKVDKVTINDCKETKKIVRYKENYILAFTDTEVIVGYLGSLAGYGKGKENNSKLF